MRSTHEPLVSICLPVRNGARRLEGVVRSVLAQRHEHLELVISDNASTDDTEEVCRELVRTDPRVVYHRQPENVGMLNNFITAMRLARGTFFRWVGDDDWLAPTCISRGVEVFAADERVERFAEMLRLLNESYLLLDPLYGLMRREAVANIPRRNMLREDQVFAAKMALAGPWGHVPEVLARRGWRDERRPQLARRLGVPTWHAAIATALQCRELLRSVRDADLDPAQRRRARAAVARWYVGRQRLVMANRRRQLASVATRLVAPARTASGSR